MGFLSRRRKPTTDTAPVEEVVEPEGPPPHEELLAYLGGRSEEELQLELANYDSNRIGLIARTAGRYAELPAEALRLGQLTNLGVTLKAAYARDPEWFGEFAATLPEDIDSWIKEKESVRTRTAQIDGKWGPSVHYVDSFLEGNEDATVEDLERVIGLMPIPDDLGREAYVPTVCRMEEMDITNVMSFIERINSAEQRDNARVTAVKLMTSKDASIGIRAIRPLIDSIEKRPRRREAQISAAKHFATNRSESPLAIAAFIRGISTKAARRKAMEAVAERYVFAGKAQRGCNAEGVELLVTLIDSFPEAERPDTREQLCKSLAGSEDNNYSDGRTTRSRIYESDLRGLLVPRTGLTTLLEKVGA